MPDETTWPPPPKTADPATAPDEFLAARVRASTARSPASRLGLVRDLRRATGLDLRHCLGIVNAFCERHGIFPQRRGPLAWLLVLPSLAALALCVTVFVTQIALGRALDAAPAPAARRLILHERLQIEGVLTVLLVGSVPFVLLAALGRTRLARRDAEDARATLAATTPRP